MNEKEKQKEIKERNSLNAFLKFMPQYQHYSVLKKERPDYILTDDDIKLGVEITELTERHFKVMDKIMASNHGTIENVEKVKSKAREGYKTYADSFEYYDINGKLALGSGVYSISKLKKRFAKQIEGKYDKYENEFCLYDEFFILCDARQTFGVENEYDVQDIIKNIKELKKKFKLAVLYTDEHSKNHCSIYQF